MQLYTVEQGDCLSSISAKYGFLWQTIWDTNSELKKSRTNPNILLPGDIVKIPELADKQYDCATSQRHSFVLAGSSTKFRLVVEQYNVAVANRPFILTIDNQVHQGTTDETGLLEVTISPTAKGGRLQMAEDQVDIEFTLGTLDPVEESSGVRQRLQNLGFLASKREDEIEPNIEAAVMYFQSSVNLQATGQLDENTRSKLLLMHDHLHTQKKAQGIKTET